MENETLEIIGEAIPNIKISIKAKNVYLTIYQVEKEAPTVPVQELEKIKDDKEFIQRIVKALNGALPDRTKLIQL